ncbi:MAG: nuclear transport factor 2 family protein [Planctomycetaceae bacterium]
MFTGLGLHVVNPDVQVIGSPSDVAFALIHACSLRGTNMNADVSTIAQTILGIERSANERWNKGDCSGYLEIYSEDITYFDPVTEKLLVGRKAAEAHILKLYSNPHIVRSEYRNPEVAVSDDGHIAVLSYNLWNFIADDAGGEKLLTNWNCTEVYRLSDGKWRITHSHWSFVQHPAIMQNATV